MSRAKRPVYDDKFRASAVLMLEAAGYKPDGTGAKGALARVAKELGIQERTLSRWARMENNPPPAHVVSEKRAELRALLRQEIEAALGQMKEARPEASYRDLGTVVGILIDKLRLISGEPTENNTTRIIIEYADLASDFAETPALAGASSE